MWIYLPTSVSSQEQAGSTLPSDSLCQTLAASVMWRSSYRQPQFWRRAFKTVPWIQRLFGPTFALSHPSSTVAERLEQFSVSPVRICLSQENKRDLSRETDQDSSTAPCESFARLGANGVFLKTSRQSSLFPQDTPYCENLPKAGSMRNGFLFERPTLALRTDESAFSSWPTARAEDSESCGNHPSASGGGDSLTGVTLDWRTPNTRDHHAGGPRLDADQRQTALVDQAEVMWRSPAAQEAGISTERLTGELGSRMYDKETGRNAQYGLTQQTELWKTPHGMANVDASGKQGGSGGGEFGKQATQWTTPQAHDSGGAIPKE